jgi:putative DNA primase/helicase
LNGKHVTNGHRAPDIVDDDIPDPTPAHPIQLLPKAPRLHDEQGRYIYRDAETQPWLTVVRVPGPKGKAFRQFNHREGRWTGKGGGTLPDPRPPYHLPELLAKPDEPVVVVAGEKCAEAVRSLGWLATTNLGGELAIDKTDWSPLARRIVVIWRDNDRTGVDWAQKLARKLTSLGAKVFFVDPPPNRPDKWDAADALEAGEGALANELIRDALRHGKTPEPASLSEETLSRIDDLLPTSQDSLALQMVARYADTARYDHTSGRWYIWDGSRWRPNEDELALEWAKLVCREQATREKKAVAKELGKAATIHAVDRLARTDRRVAATSAIFDQDKLLLATPGGTVDLRTGLMRAADPADMITKCTAVTPSGHAERATLWFDFLNQTTNSDQGVIDLLQEVAGYCLTGLTTEHALFFIYGPGGNGKSVFINTIRKIMGDYAVSAPMDTFVAAYGDRHPTDLAMLQGARLVTASETEEGRAWAESRIKQLTGGDPITARFMRQDFFTYEPEFKLWFVGNHRPVLRVVDEATRRRYRIMAFLNKPGVVDKDLEAKLRPEWPHILQWAIEGALRWQKNGLSLPKSVEDQTEGYFSEQDIIGQWMADRCDRDPMPIHESSMTRGLTAKLFGSFVAWCKQNGEEPGSNKRFSIELERRGYIRHRTMYGKEFIGVRLTRPQEDEPGGYAY